MNIDTPAEAFAAIAAVMVGADGIGSNEERRYLLEEMSALPAFESLDSGAFTELVQEISDAVWTSLPNDGVRITDEGIETLIQACLDVLDPASCEEACRMAEALADVDERTHEEHGLILTLRDRFGVAEA